MTDTTGEVRYEDKITAGAFTVTVTGAARVTAETREYLRQDQQKLTAKVTDLMRELLPTHLKLQEGQDQDRDSA